MDIQTRLQRKNQQAALRARRMNKTARRLLQDKIDVLESTFKKQEKLIFRQTKSIEYEMRCSNKDNEQKLHTNTAGAAHQTDVLQTSGNDTNCCLRNARLVKCRFHGSSNCRFFPCQQVATYHSIGYNVRAPTGCAADHGTSKTYVIHDGVLQDARDVVAPKDDEPISSRISPRNSIQDRERGLKQLVKEMKLKNNQQRPRAWAINYGDPVPRRQLLKPVIPVSDRELESH